MRDRCSAAPGVLLGLGLGGFVDGILLHQVVQWHAMLSAVVPPTTMEAMRRNMMFDGFFHVATLTMVTIGVFMLLRDATRGVRLPTTKAFTGLLFLGWGMFNLVEGVIDHHILDLHHVRDLPVHVPMYDWIFLIVGGLGFIGLGKALARDPVAMRAEEMEPIVR